MEKRQSLVELGPVLLVGDWHAREGRAGYADHIGWHCYECGETGAGDGADHPCHLKYLNDLKERRMKLTKAQAIGLGLAFGMVLFVLLVNYCTGV
jgi:hypothetical protein